MSWNICLSTTFFNDLSRLSQSVAKKVARAVDSLEQDPYRGDIKKIQGQEKCYRLRVGEDHRLIYSISNSWVKLLRVGDRKEIYKWRIGDANFWHEDYGDFDDISPPSSGLFTEEELRGWGIPEKYRPILLGITDENQLLEVKIPSRYVEILLDRMFPSSVEEIEAQPEKITSSKALEKFIDKDIADFWLKLDEKQRDKVEMNAERPVLVKGAPGTGKSTLALHRIKYLIDSGVKNILFTTYSESLVRYSHGLLQSLLGEAPEKLGVTVKTCDEIVLDHYPRDSSALQLPEDGGALILQSLLKGCEKSSSLRNLGADYILEEFETIIQARYITTEGEYLEHDRYGRVKPLKNRQRQELWQLYQKWLRKLAELGYMSIGAVRQRTLEAIEKNRVKPFDAIIIDECQDLSPVALRLLALLVKDPKNLYLTADTSQSLYQRGFAWNYIQDVIRFKSDIFCLIRAYRSTAAIMKACLDIIQSDSSGDAETYVIKKSSFMGERPQIILKDDWLTEVETIHKFLTKSSRKYSIPIYSSAIICPGAQMGKLIARQLETTGLNAKYLEGGEIHLAQACVKVISLESAKGLEFPFVVVTGLEEGVFPDYRNLISEEKREFLRQQRRKFYTACTRAMRSLLVYGSRSNPSIFIKELNNNRNWEFYNG